MIFLVFSLFFFLNPAFADTPESQYITADNNNFIENLTLSCRGIDTEHVDRVELWTNLTGTWALNQTVNALRENVTTAGEWLVRRQTTNSTKVPSWASDSEHCWAETSNYTGYLVDVESYTTRCIQTFNILSYNETGIANATLWVYFEQNSDVLNRSEFHVYSNYTMNYTFGDCTTSAQAEVCFNETSGGAGTLLINDSQLTLFQDVPQFFQYDITNDVRGATAISDEIYTLLFTSQLDIHEDFPYTEAGNWNISFLGYGAQDHDEQQYLEIEPANTSNTVEFNFNNTALGSYAWNCHVYDNATNLVTNETNYTFRVMEGVDITIEEPLNNTNTDYGTINLNYTFTNTTAIDWCWITVDNINVSVTSPNLTFMPSNYINYWKFDEGSGILAEDTGNIDDLTLTADSWTSGISNNAFYSDSQYYAHNDTKWSGGITENGTISFYFKPDIEIDETLVETDYLFEKHFGDAGGLNMFLIRVGGGDAISYGNYVNNTFNEIRYNTTFSAGTWYKIDAIFGKGGMKLYLDNVLIEDKAVYDVPFGTGSEDLVFGYSLRSTAYYFDGAIDEARIYDYQVTPTGKSACSSDNTTFTKNELKTSFPVQVFVNDTNGIVYKGEITISTDTDFEIRANITGGATLNSFSLSMMNSTDTIVKSTTTGINFFNWSETVHGDNVNVTVSSTGYNNFSVLVDLNNETYTWNTTYFLTPVIFTINIFDEQNLSSILGNITISNSTSSVKHNNTDSIALNFSQIPVGEVTIIIENDEYESRTYYDNIISGISDTLNAYLLKTSEGLLVRFHVKDQNDQPVFNALVRSSRIINDVLTLVEEDKTDSSGTATHFLDPEKTYTVVASKSGYSSANITINPTQQDYYLILRSASQIDFNNQFAGIFYQFVPSQRYIGIGGNSSINFSVYSMHGELTSFSLEIVNETGDIIFNETQTGAEGGIIYGYVNLTGYSNNHQLKVTGIFIKTGLNPYRIDKYYYTLSEPSGNYTLWRFFNKADSTLPDTLKLLIMVIVTLIVSGFGAKMGGSKAGGVVMLVMFAMFTAVGWLLPEYFALIVFVVLGMLLVI